jgi:hypothetical protein
VLERVAAGESGLQPLLQLLAAWDEAQDRHPVQNAPRCPTMPI